MMDNNYNLENNEELEQVDVQEFERFDPQDFSINDIRKIDKRRMICIVGLTAIAILLCFLRFRPPLVSGLFSVDFSVLPELIATIAYGPVAGIIVCFIKFFFHITFVPTSLIPDVSEFFVEIIYIVFAEIFYSAHMYMAFREGKNPKKFERERAIFIGSFLGMIPALIFQFLSLEFFVFPKLEKYYADQGMTYENIIANFNQTSEALRNHFPNIAQRIPEIKGIWQGILLVNLPVTFIKLLLVTLVTMLIYRFISPFLHYRQV